MFQLRSRVKCSDSTIPLPSPPPPTAGRDFSHDETLDVPTQVELLIKQATSHENLCQCYIGWSVLLPEPFPFVSASCLRLTRSAAVEFLSPPNPLEGAANHICKSCCSPTLCDGKWGFAWLVLIIPVSVFRCPFWWGTHKPTIFIIHCKPRRSTRLRWVSTQKCT